MKNQTLRFHSSAELSQFAKQLYGGYLLNRLNNTITSCFSDHYLELAINNFKATIIDQA